MSKHASLAAAGLALAAALAWTAACSPDQCDPNSAELFKGIACAAGDGYKIRREQGEATLAQAQQQLAESQAAAQAAARERELSAHRLAELQAQSAALDQDLTALQDRLALLTGQRHVDEAKLTRINQAMAAARAASQTAHNAPSQAALDAQKARQKEAAAIIEAY